MEQMRKAQLENREVLICTRPRCAWNRRLFNSRSARQIFYKNFERLKKGANGIRDHFRPSVPGSGIRPKGQQ